MKTDVILSFRSDDKIERLSSDHLRIKTDSNGFPYIVLRNEKIIISKTEFPFYYDNRILFISGTFDIVSGQDELETILANPELTSDKVRFHNIMRMA